MPASGPQTYLIRTRRDGRGVELFGPRLPYGLWFLSHETAEDYARHMTRDTGGRLWTLTVEGFPIVAEELATTHTGDGTQYGPQVPRGSFKREGG